MIWLHETGLVSHLLPITSNIGFAIAEQITKPSYTKKIKSLSKPYLFHKCLLKVHSVQGFM